MLWNRIEITCENSIENGPKRKNFIHTHTHNNYNVGRAVFDFRPVRLRSSLLIATISISRGHRINDWEYAESFGGANIPTILHAIFHGSIHQATFIRICKQKILDTQSQIQPKASESINWWCWRCEIICLTPTATKMRKRMRTKTEMKMKGNVFHRDETEISMYNVIKERLECVAFYLKLLHHSWHSILNGWHRIDIPLSLTMAPNQLLDPHMCGWTIWRATHIFLSFINDIYHEKPRNK